MELSKIDFAAMIQRVIRAATLEPAVYEEVEANANLNQEALAVVVLVSLANGVGLFLSGLLGGSVGAAIGGLIFGLVSGVLGYYIWAYITYWVGTNLFQGTADVGEMLRTLGYASGPRVLGILTFIPCLGGLAGLIGGIWSLVTGVVAVRQALDFDTGKAILTVIIGWIIVLVITLILGTFLGIGAIGIGVLSGGLR
ncbi:MAG: YIP1 family protein [Anaerolineae bacterium]|nr:YIP1 family protein [Anaerolineae bacterium]MDW8100544.1 YIP1 family protein [Anaerolineae bacterium]